MNNVYSLWSQQLGFSKWKNYDCMLRRLRCSKEDEFKGIWGWDTEADNDPPIFACKFSRKKGYENLIALANEDGHLVVHDIDNKEPRIGRQIHQNAIFDVDWLCDSFKVITVSGDHTARLVDAGDGDMRTEQFFTGHTLSVKTVAVRKTDASVFATGSRDGSIRVWDIRSSLGMNVIGNPDRTINNSHCRTTPTSSSKRKLWSTGTAAANSVTGLVFQNDDTLISSGSGDGVIKVWDLRKTYTTSKRDPFPKNIIPYSGSTTRNGFSNLAIDPYGIRLYANCLDNTIYCYNIATYDINPVMEYRGHINSTFYIKSIVSDDGLYLMSGSSDQNAYIWNVDNPDPLVSLKGHTSEVTCVAWKSKGDFAVVTCSDDIRHKVWRLGSEILPDNWEILVRGRAESTPKGPTKRSGSNENTPLSAKRFRLDSNKRNLEDAEMSEAKRQNTGRRLFDLTNNLPTAKVESLATILEADDEGAPQTKRPRMMEFPSPKETFSPTTNLPNFVMDGSAPHLYVSPQKRRDKDWLTKIRVERQLIREMQDLANGGPSTPKMPKLEEGSPRSAKPSRRRSGSQGRASPQNPILRFFRVTNGNTPKDGSCSPKSSLISQNSHNIQSTNRE